MFLIGYVYTYVYVYSHIPQSCGYADYKLNTTKIKPHAVKYSTAEWSPI